MTVRIEGTDMTPGHSPYPDDLRQFYDSAPCGFLSTRWDGTITAANQTVARYLDLDVADLIGRPMQSLVDAGGRIYFETHLKPLLSLQGFLREIAMDLVSPSGHRLPILLGARLSKPGMQATLVHYTVVDATERRRYENDVLAYAKRERESRDLLQSVLDSLPAMIAVLDGEGAIVRVNQPWEAQRRLAGGDGQCGAGSRYLEVCDNAAAGGCRDAANVAAGLRAVLRREQHAFEYDYDMDSGEGRTGRWFRLIITAITGQPGAIAVHFDVTAQVILEADLRKQAAHDSLTRLPNRTGLERYLAATLADGTGSRRLTLFFIDLDHFKQINDQYGHAAGDAVLVEIGRRIAAVTRADDFACRLGGDEFVLSLVDCSRTQAEAIAERLQASLCEPVDIGQCDVDVSVSIGVATTELRQPDAHSLIARADSAMYAAKAAGRNGHRFAS